MRAARTNAAEKRRIFSPTFPTSAAGQHDLACYNPRASGGNQHRSGLSRPTEAVAQVAQLVEHATENRSVGGSTPSLGTTTCNLRNFLNDLRKVRPYVGHHEKICLVFTLQVAFPDGHNQTHLDELRGLVSTGHAILRCKTFNGGGALMPDVAYTTVPGKISSLLAKIRSNGVPKKVDSVWLKAIGFTSSNDKSLLPVLKSIDFVDGSKAPTERWRSYRGADGPIVLGEAIRHAYSDLYDFYDDAHDRSNQEIANVFKTKSNAGDQAIGKQVGTFKSLAVEAKFDGSSRSRTEDEPSADNGRPLNNPSVPAAPQERLGSSSPSLHIDLQVHISPEASADQIDKIFASMAKHLYRKGD